MADELQEIYEKYEILSGAKDKILEVSLGAPLPNGNCK